MSAFEELQGKLREIFQLDRNDLDFGLYRIMNLKSQEVTQFIDNDLLSQVKEGLSKYISNDNKSIQEELDKSIKDAKALGIDPETSPKVKELKAKLTSVFDAEKVENEIYSDLYNFFKRYYSEGDFMSLRRYKEGVYALPYEGEEVKLHWANADQYYVKSGETLTNFTFKVGSSKVRFEVIQATTEQNNNKDDKNRRFKLVDEETGKIYHEDREEYEIIPPVREENGEFIISFSYLPNNDAVDKNGKKIAKAQDVINEEMADILLKNQILLPIANNLNKLTGTEKHRITYILKQLNNFTAKNTFDYFIHKDLGKFLNRELDFYIKNEIMHLDDIDNETVAKVEQYLGKIKVLRRVARKIIQFLSSLENFQKKIWLKKKFVLEANYCITLDRVPEELYPSIVANEKQKEEWIKLFAIDEINGYTGKLTIDFLKNNPFLVLDTAFFDTDFKYKLLASIDDFDKQCDGLLIHSENFQALNLVCERYRNQVDGIYIDPPYNSKSSEIIYKNDYKHSSWLSLMQDRIRLSRLLLLEDGIITTAIDDYELPKLWELYNSIFGYDNHLGTISIRINPKGRMTSTKVSAVHEYTLLFGNSENATVRKLPQNPEDKTHNYKQDSNGVWYLPNNLRKQGVDSEAEKSDGTLSERFFPIYYDPDTHQVSSKKELKIKILPIDSSGNKRIWRRGIDAIDEMYEKGDIWVNEIKGEYQVYYKFYGGLDGQMVQSMWIEPECSASDYGTKILDNTLGKRELFSYPKAPFAVRKNILTMTDNKNSIILDFFAGSGTTGDVVINLNREDNGNRKYILVEMGKYFDLVTKPRVEKVIYSEDWKDGKPISRKGSSHCFKYIRLESYEDALDNLEIQRSTAQEDLLSKPQNKEIKEEYILNYMMDLETQGSLLNVSDFEHPFDYEMKITRDGETKTVKVDLVETFNYLIGLNVESIRKSKEIVAIEGRTRSGEKTLVLWRDTAVVDNKTLDNWFEKQNYSTLDMEFDTIYVNGNNNLENLRKGDETWKVRLTEAEFLKRMFDVKDV